MSSFQARSKGRKGVKPTPHPPFPKPAYVHAIQFQFFDNGPNPGSGKTEHAIKLEVYMEPKVDLVRPHWVRVVGLHDAKTVMKWVDEKIAEEKLAADWLPAYQEAADWCAHQLANPDMEWAKIGRIGDNRRKDVIFPGQMIVACREISGPMITAVAIAPTAEDSEGPRTIMCERWIHDQFSTKGTGRRKAFGFFDPGKSYWWQQAERECIGSGKTARELMVEWGHV